MKELVDSIFKTFRERLTNPFFGSFVISWILWNWKFVLVFISDDYETLYKIGVLIDKYSDIKLMLFAPLATSLLYILFADHFYLWIEKNQKNIKIQRYKEKSDLLKERTSALEEGVEATEKGAEAAQKSAEAAEKTAEATEKAAEAAEQALEDQKRLAAAERELKIQTTNAIVNTPKNINIKYPGQKDVIQMDTGGRGAELISDVDIIEMSFKVCSHDLSLASYPIESKSTYEIRLDDFAGKILGQFDLFTDGQLKTVKLTFTSPFRKFTFVNTNKVGPIIELYNMKLKKLRNYTIKNK